MDLIVRIRKRLPLFDLDVSFACPAENLLALVGPSGAGKTTIIRIIAGLDKPDEGIITFNGQTWVDTEKKIFLPPQERRLGYVFQEYTLFPHLNIYRNVCFAAKKKELVEELMKGLGIWELQDRKPHMVSGGERQRCAIAQALARQPRVLLMDEPFSALDVTTRRKLRQQVKSLKNDLAIPVIHVTHDIDEALFLADDILPLIKGRIMKKWMMQFLLKNPVKQSHGHKVHKSIVPEIEPAITVNSTERKVS